MLLIICDVVFTPFPVMLAACLKLPGSHNLTVLTVAMLVVCLVFTVVCLVAAAAAEVAVAAAGAGVADGVGVLEVDIQ